MNHDSRRTTTSRRVRARVAARRSRRGFITLLALVCVTVFVAGAAAMTRLVALERRQQRQSELRAQAEWLAEAGLDRARVQLAADPDWSGETWTIPAEEFERHGAATVVISLTSPTDDEPAAIRVTAEYPAGEAARVRAERTVRLN